MKVFLIINFVLDLHLRPLNAVMEMQAYIAIHQPKDLNDADLARRRFVFDEFFYLQVPFNLHKIFRKAHFALGLVSSLYAFLLLMYLLKDKFD